MSEFDYDAFISYRRSDGTAVARWLRRALVGYRLPRALRSRHADELRVYLDTVHERATSDFYERSIKPALQSSRFLIAPVRHSIGGHADGKDSPADHRSRL
jgi:hypothetical protein